MISNKTRVTVRSLSNQNLNRPESNTLGTLNSHIIVVPIDASHCQNMTSENMNLREELTDELCRRSHEPSTYINREIYCSHCRPFIFPNVPFHPMPTKTPQHILNQETEHSQNSKQSSQIRENFSETQSTPYSGRSFLFLFELKS